MNEDYLWDRSGEPEREVEHLEQLLGQLRWTSRRQRDLPYVPAEGWWLKTRWWAMAAAATIVMFGIGTAFFLARMHPAAQATSWRLSLAGHEPSTVRPGQVIETTAITSGTISSQFIGEVEIEPNSRLRLAFGNEQRLALDHGTIHALIWAPPAKFVVDTPAARTVDLGCQYTLQVAKSGEGFLTVEVGWVAFQWHNLESFIPASAACRTHPGHGPGTPHFLDASEALTNALTQFDLTESQQALDTVLSTARPRDGLTLWHLLQRTQKQQRAEVFECFSKLVNMPSGVTRQSILNGDPKSMDAAWDALQLGNTGWWREWKREW